MDNFKWQHIQFEDGNNPYICTAEREFKRIRRKYRLVKIKDGFWLAKMSLSELLSKLNEKFRTMDLDIEVYEQRRFSIVTNYCREKKFRLSTDERHIIKCLGLESAVNAIR